MNKDELKVKAKTILDQYLEVNNHRRTPERYAILNAVVDMSGHFTLEELGSKLSDEMRFPVSRATLYNTLNLFVKLRIVIRHHLASTTTYEYCQPGGCNVHQVCSNCGKVTELMSKDVDEAIGSLHLKRFRRESYAV